jgi:predicted nicotinamide N-methyase
MDFLKHRGMPERTRVMEVGCGWGLAGIYCARKHGALVTGVDVDSEVFPYLRLHAVMNRVVVTTMKKGFDTLTTNHLEDFDVVIGSDICFWGTMADSLKGLIGRALATGVQLVLIADPGRSPFEELGAYFVENHEGEMMNWAVENPYSIHGRILKVGSLTYL